MRYTVCIPGAHIEKTTLPSILDSIEAQQLTQLTSYLDKNRDVLDVVK